GEAQTAELLKARDIFARAGDDLKKASDLLDAEAKAKPKGQEQDKLLQAKLRADLDRALNLLDQVATYTGDKASKERTKVVLEAQKILEAVRDLDEKNPLCHVARAWLVSCYHDNMDDRAYKLFNNIIKTQGAAAAEGRRLARYIHLSHYPLHGEKLDAKA